MTKILSSKCGVYGSIDFFIGKALNDEQFRITVIDYLKKTECPNDFYKKIVDCLTQETFAFPDLLKHGQPLTAFAMEIANKYAKQKLGVEQFTRTK